MYGVVWAVGDYMGMYGVVWEFGGVGDCMGA